MGWAGALVPALDRIGISLALLSRQLAITPQWDGHNLVYVIACMPRSLPPADAR